MGTFKERLDASIQFGEGMGTEHEARARMFYRAGAKAALEILSDRITRIMDIDDDDSAIKPLVDELRALARELEPK